MKTPFDFGRRRLDGCNPEANLSLYGRLAAEVAMTRMLRQPALCLRRDHGKLAPDAAQDLNALRSFRNTVVHEPKKIKAGDLQEYLDLARSLKARLHAGIRSTSSVRNHECVKVFRNPEMSTVVASSDEIISLNSVFGSPMPQLLK